MGKLFLLIKSLLLSIVILGYLGTHANAALSAGDIAFVEFNSDNPDTFAFVALVDIAENEEILFTDNGWKSDNSWRTGEGNATWIAPSGGISKGSVVKIVGTTVTGGGTVSTNAIAFSNDGDQIIAYQTGNAMIAALNVEGASTWQSDATSSNTSALAQGLTNGTNAVALTELDNYKYTGTTTGDKATLLAAINNASNWSGSDTTAQTFLDTFTITTGAGDTTPPTLASTTPADDATDVAIYASLIITFDENIAKGSSGTVEIRKTSDNSLVESLAIASSSLTLDGKALIINPTATLEYNTQYYVLISSGAIKDTSDNDFAGISDATAWSFTTAATSANLKITEIWSGNVNGSNLTADWFEITNTGNADWNASVDPLLYYDDDSKYASTADLIEGITHIPSGKSVIVVIGNSADADTFKTVWSPDFNLEGIEVGYTNGAGLGGGGDGVTLWLDTPQEGEHVDYQSYPDTSSNTLAQSYDVDLGAFSTVGNANQAVVTTAQNDMSESAVGSPGNQGPTVGILRITEYMYSGTDGEFFELTNVGNADINMSGWSFDDDSRTAGSVDLSAFGIIKAGESVIVTESLPNDFRTAWGLCEDVKVLQNASVGLGRNDEINIYDDSDTLIDRLAYGDQTYVGTIRTQNKSGWVDAQGLGDNNASAWSLSSDGDTQGSTTSTSGDIGSPAFSVRATVSYTPPCAIINPNAPTLVFNPDTSDYIDAGETTLSNITGTVGTTDSTDPVRTLGVEFNVSDLQGVATTTVTATSSNQAVVPDAKITVTGSTTANINLKIEAIAQGVADINLTVKDGDNNSSTIILHYSASTLSDATSRLHTGTSDGSSAVAVDSDYMLVADDEHQNIGLYHRSVTGMAVKTFDFTSALGLSAGDEVDLEASTRIGNTLYWIGSHSNDKDGNTQPTREILFSTTLTGSGTSTSLAYVNKYTTLESNLKTWDSTNAHGLGANYFGFSASSADGIVPEATSGFSIEGLTMKPNSTSIAYLGFRAPLSNTTTRTKALIVPIENFDTMMGSTPNFGQPIELDLGGRGIRSIECNANGCIIIAGASDASGNFALFTWDGNASSTPQLRSATLSGEGSFEGIVELPSGSFMGSDGDAKTLQLIRDNGDTDWYNTGTNAKKLAQTQWKKFQSDSVTLGSVVVTSSIIKINEVDSDTPSSDVLEFVELYDGGVGNSSLDGLVLVFFNGNDDKSYKAFDLDGNTTDANGFFVLGNSAVANVSYVFSGNTLQNGADAVALYLASALDFPNGTAVITTHLVDAIVYGTSDTDDNGLLTGLGQSTQYDENANSDGANQSLSRNPDGNGTFVAQEPTSGERNIPIVSTPTATFIHEIQGGGTSSPLDGQSVSVRAIVVGDFQDGDSDTKRNLKGFYIQEEDNETDGNASTSEGIFVYENGNFIKDVSVGDWVEINGSVDEYYGETQIFASSVRVLSSGNALPTPAIISLPTPSTTLSQASKHQPELEAFEGMLVEFSDTLTITEMYQLGRFNEIKLSQGGRAEQFTQNNTPNTTTYTAYLKTIGARTITYDDGLSLQNGAIGNLDGFGPTFNTASDKRMGDTITHLKGVLTYQWAGNSASGTTWRVRSYQDGINSFTKANHRLATPSSVGGKLKVASLNVLNYFNTLDNSGAICGPNDNMDCRGANDATELTRQTQKLVKVLQSLDADVVGFMEIENNYHKGTPAIKYLVDELNSALGSTVYEYVLPSGNVGDDVIAVGIIYKIATVQLVTGTTVEMLDDSNLPVGMSAPIFNGSGTNRVPLAATFEEIATGEKFTFVVTHMKSKGSAGSNTGDSDLGDGAGASNGTRLLGVTALKKWLDSDPTGSGDEDFMVVGDMNAYAKEDPILYFEDNNYTDLARKFLGSDAYSYVFDGQIGTLDYAFANTALLKQVTGAIEWHINADEASAIDYNTDFGRDVNMFDGTLPYRQSDHDPVVVGLKLGNAKPISKSATIQVAQEGSYAFGSANFYFDDNDTSDTFQKLVITALPTKGSLKFNGTLVTLNQEINASDIAQLSYAPNVGESGNSYTSFGFKVNDGEDNSTLSYTITINVTPTPPPANIAPTAGFSFVVSGLSANFTDSSTDSDGSIVSWEWSFGDGNSSTSQNPTHTYATSGNYNVTLTVTDNNGVSSDISKSVTVTQTNATQPMDENTTVENNTTQPIVDDNTTASANNNTTIETNTTEPSVENNTTHPIANPDENNDTIIENKGDLVPETNTTQLEENTTLEANTTISPEGNLSQTFEANATQVPSEEDAAADTNESLEQNTTQDEVIEDSLTAHDGLYKIQIANTIVEFARNHEVQIDEDANSIKATIAMERQIIEIRLNKATQTLTITLTDSLSGHTKSVTFNLKGSQTFVDEEGNIIITTPTEAAHSIKTTLTPRGKVEHIVIFERQTTKALFEVDANTTMDENATLTTQTQIEQDGFIYRAIVITNYKGKSKTKFIKINPATGKEIELHHTLRSDREFRHGSTIRVFVRNGKLFIQSKTLLDDDLMIE